jgi:hypothetical protein
VFISTVFKPALPLLRYLSLLFRRTSGLLQPIGGSSLADVAEYLYQSRFNKLYPVSQRDTESIKSLCNSAFFKEFENATIDVRGNISFASLTFQTTNTTLLQLVEANLANFLQTAEEVGSAVEQVAQFYDASAASPDLRHGRSLAKEFLGDYLEQLARFAVGVDLTPGFLCVCLAARGKG